MTDPTTPTATPLTGTRVGWGALVDLIDSCRPVGTYRGHPVRSAEESATMRAVAMIFGRGYNVGDYGAVFRMLDTELGNGTDTITIVRTLLDTWGRA